MYEILHFRLALYLLLGLGFAGFTIATGSPFMFVVSIGLLLVNGFLFRTGRFRPMPRWLANALTLAVAIYTGLTISGSQQPIFPIGNFLVALQIIKLFEQRANRDYAQLLVLSLLLMVAAAISTAGLGFGVTFIIYLLLSPYACLLFHLKVEADHAKRLAGLDERQPDPITLRQDQRYLNRSMTRVTGAVGLVSLGMAVIVFLFFPRVPGANLLAFQFRPGGSQTGMSEEMSMKSVTSVQQNTAEVAALRVTHNGTPVTGGSFYLRGTVYDIYDGDPASPNAWSWGRSSGFGDGPTPIPRNANEETPLVPNLAGSADDDDPNVDRWVQEFMPLKPLGVSFLPAMPGATRISVTRRLPIAYNASDGVISMAADQPVGPIYYRVTSTNVQPEVIAPPPSRRRPAFFSPIPFRRLSGDSVQPPAPASDAGDDSGSDDANPPILADRDGPPMHPGDNRIRWPRASIINEKIREYARRPEVSGTDASGNPLYLQLEASLRNAPRNQLLPTPPAVTEEIARNIERHLRSQFTYTLDLSTAAHSSDNPHDEDPVVRFLYDTRSGWCEHFAYAMTLMCQSLHMQARIVSGYHCDEFNSMGGYFVVRQSQAHAWVEVLVRDGDHNVWETFDPTGSRDADAVGGDNAWRRFSHVFDYLEHVWANSVVAYDAQAQNSLLDRVEGQLANSSDTANTVVRGTERSVFGFVQNLFDKRRYDISAAILTTVLCAIITGGLALIAWYLIVRFRLMRRARRIGLVTLGKPEARRLARQLGFYDDLVRVLERRAIVRAPHLTPLEFGESLSFLPREAYDAIVRLTRIFYRVRYGELVLTPARQRSLERVVERLRDVINPKLNRP